MVAGNFGCSKPKSNNNYLHEQWEREYVEQKKIYDEHIKRSETRSADEQRIEADKIIKQYKAHSANLFEQSKRYVDNEMAKYDKIRLGMSRQQVFNICGEPYRTSKTISYSSTIEIWTYSIVKPEPYVFLTFQNDKLVRITQP